MSELLSRMRASLRRFFAPVPASVGTDGVDLKRFSVWVTTSCLWGLAAAALIGLTFEPLRLPELNPGPTVVMAILTVFLGGLVLVLPWERWGSGAILIMGIVAVPYLVTFNHVTNFTGTAIGVGVAVSEYFCMLAICGLTQRRGIPFVYGMYVGVMFFTASRLTEDSWPLAISPILAIPFTAMVGETIAWTVGELRDARHEIEHLAASRQVMLTNLMRAVEHDRHRVAAQLHEQAVGDLAVMASIMRASNAVQPHERSAELDKVLAGIREEMTTHAESLRRLMLAVRPPVLEDSLTAAVSAFATEVFAEGPQVGLTVNVDPDVVLDWTTETIVYRVVQEALQNVGRHAQASNVTVTVAAPDQALEITVEDDGVGFDPGEVLFESGIATMRMFVGLGRGVLTIDSRPGSGTRVHVELGVTDDPPADVPNERGTLRLIVGGADGGTPPDEGNVDDGSFGDDAGRQPAP